MKDKKTKPWINFDLSDTISTLVILTLIILFVGTPDLWDVIINKLSNGQVPIPAPR